MLVNYQQPIGLQSYKLTLLYIPKYHPAVSLNLQPVHSPKLCCYINPSLYRSLPCSTMGSNSCQV